MLLQVSNTNWEGKNTKWREERLEKDEAGKNCGLVEFSLSGFVTTNTDRFELTLPFYKKAENLNDSLMQREEH